MDVFLGSVYVLLVLLIILLDFHGEGGTVKFVKSGRFLFANMATENLLVKFILDNSARLCQLFSFTICSFSPLLFRKLILLTLKLLLLGLYLCLGCGHLLLHATVICFILAAFLS